MADKLLIDAHYRDETRIAIIDENGKLESFEAEHSGKKPIKGNIYLAKVVRVEPAIQAAFIDYGGDKNGFLPLSEIHYDYFNKNITKSPENGDSIEANEGDESNPEKKANKPRQFRIQEVISSKQILLVQAEKEVRGNKCAFFTTFVSLPGRYCVLIPNPQKGKSNGVSRKIEFSEKERLREILGTLEVPEGMGCIVRTSGENKTKQEIKRDLEYLCRLWNELREKVTASIAPLLIYEEGNIIKRTIRDLYNKSTEKIIVQGKDAYRESRTFMKLFTPSHVKKIELYEEDSIPIFQKYEVEDKISKILEPIVNLPSGGSIVINTTEALTAIDVNSGKMRNERDITETAIRTNLEAAVEIARQIRLRDIAGIIVIDFIDMSDYSSISKLEKKMKDEMKGDYSSVQFSKISNFGLMEISRQRLRTSLADSTFVQCKHCGGSGKILANETVALAVIRKIENFLVNEKAKHIVAEVANEVDLFILNHKRILISEMETLYGAFIEISRNSSIKQMDCKITVKEYKEEKQEKQEKQPTIIKQNLKKEEVISDSSEKLINKTNIKSHKIKHKEKETTQSLEIAVNQQKPVEKTADAPPAKKRRKKKKKPVESNNMALEIPKIPELIVETKVIPAQKIEAISDTKQEPDVVKKKRRRKYKKPNAQNQNVSDSPSLNVGGIETENQKKQQERAEIRTESAQNQEPNLSLKKQEISQMPNVEQSETEKKTNPKKRGQKRNGWIKKMFG